MISLEIGIESLNNTHLLVPQFDPDLLDLVFLLDSFRNIC